ncbi:MAG: molybdopterin biosynthesis protein, partial [Caldilineaceae bacterium]|nr:molybdopterin biosynthesis protein [Caldilineaceae bacterium]
MDERNIYLHDIALDDAVTAWNALLAANDLLQPLPSETIPLVDALGRVTAAPVWAKISAPHYHAAAMDGYAVHADATRGATETSPKALRIGQQAFAVDTGDPLPPGTNAVIMIEHIHLVEEEDATFIEILESSPPWRYVRPMGEDMVATELVLPANHKLRPQDLGA